MPQYPTTQMILESQCKLTPMMRQYFEIKKQHKGIVLLFRMGDFYEAFFEDAVTISQILSITLTHRGKMGGFSIPMAGLPHHAASSYIDKITGRGKKVAIAEQMEDPKDAIGLVKRAVTQIVSPGVPYDLDKTDCRERHFISCSYIKEGRFFIAALDFTTGDFLGMVTDHKDDFLEKIRLLGPKEMITYIEQFDDFGETEILFKEYNIMRTFLSQNFFYPKHTHLYIEKLIPRYKRDHTIRLNPTILSPLGALSYYICTIQKQSNFCHIRPFKLMDDNGPMRMTLPTLMGLEIFPKAKHFYKNSLLGFLDKTSSPLGPRKLKELLTAPSNDRQEILKRQRIVNFFVEMPSLLENMREQLASIGDIERILAKTSKGKASGSDLLRIANGIKVHFCILRDIKDLPQDLLSSFTPEEVDSLRGLHKHISSTINNDIGASLEKGNLIRNGRHKERDGLAEILQDTSKKLAKLEEKYRKETGIQKLKVKSNNVAGHFIEVGLGHISKIPSSFKRRQTLANSERYTTEELALFENEILMAKSNLEILEREIFSDLMQDVVKHSSLILNLASNVAVLDTFGALALVSLHESFVRPKISESKIIDIKGAWHPLIKESLQDNFVTHNLLLDEKTFFGLITGPNMAGKTTVMREVAIIQILTQIGSFVPAASAQIGLCDHLFSRLGASDDILKGQSTFMVEMSETAEIIRHATEKSLIILDEVGRGTSTYDGLSIAWSLVEYFIDHVKARSLFATHYHELTDLIKAKKQAKNLTMEIQNQNGDIKFLYRLIEDAIGQSFGIHVAKMAGLPQEILFRATTLLQQLENKQKKNLNLIENQAPLSPPPVPEYLKHLEDDLKEIDPLKMTPLEALQKIYDLKSQISP